MDETKQQEPADSSERPETASPQIPPAAVKTAESFWTDQARQFSEQMRTARLSSLLEDVANLRHLSPAQFTGSLKRTWRLWAIAAGVFLAVMAIGTLAQRVAQWVWNAREQRHEIAVATVTPDRLIARCGEATVDVTKEVFPIVMRTMSYQASANQKLVLAFSRTAEEKSDWVFLSMNDESGAASYDTPDAKIAALPCLDSRK
jgi:hypothetical protein